MSVNEKAQGSTEDEQPQQYESFKNARILRSDDFLYTLMPSGWRKGLEQFRNRMMASFTFDREISAAEREETIRTFESAARMRSILSQIMRDLPQDRDWLDPALEQEAKMISDYINEPVLFESLKRESKKKTL